PMQKIVPDSPKPPAPTPRTCETLAEVSDVTADIELDDKRVVAAYDCAIQELMREAGRVRGDWSDTQRAAFDDKVRAMRETIAKAEGKPKKRASSALVAYIQGAVAREQILVAGMP
nr:hypothetical protein [Deltaproteobacteria bacterium]